MEQSYPENTGENSLQLLFNSWEISEDVIAKFIENGITLEILPELTTEHLKELCPHLGTRIKLQKNILEMRETADASTVSVISSNIENIESIENIDLHDLRVISDCDICVPNLSATTQLPDFDLKTLLQTSAGGSAVWNHYQKYGHLNATNQNRLTDIIIKHLYTYIVNNRLKYDQYNLLVSKIIAIFPKECPGTYFTQPIRKALSPTGQSVFARGKLVDKVRNLVFRSGERPRKRKSATDTEETSTSTGDEKHQRLNADEDVTWLQNYSEPWQTVVEKWRKTFELRQNLRCEFATVQAFINFWPILNDVRSEELIHLDFELLYPGKSLFHEWEIFLHHVTLMKKDVLEKDEKLNSILLGINDLEDNVKIPTQMLLMANLVPPKGRHSKHDKYSTQESLDALFVVAKNPGDINVIIEEKKNKALQQKNTIQPYIIIQGSLTKIDRILLVVDKIQYEFTTAFRAFDCLFKLYHVMHVTYPKVAYHLFLMVQRCVYKIITKYDSVPPYISDIIFNLS